MEILIPTLLTIITAATPLLFAALGEMVTEKSGVLNLGVEGMILLGAVCGFATVHYSGSASLGILAGLLAGAGLSVIFALLVLGSSVGTRFAGIPLHRLLKFGALTFGGTAILMGTAALLAVVVSAITGLELVALLLAYAPGGVAEMSLIAFAIDADSGFVAVHHIVRIVFVMISVPLLAAWAGRLQGTSPK